jgi:hypothetical protein
MLRSALANPSNREQRMSKAQAKLRDPTVLVYFAIAFAAFVFFGLRSDGASLLTGDAASYLYFDPVRPIGYPAFLALVRMLTGGLRWLAAIQLAAALAGILALALALRRFVGSAWAGGAALVLSAGNVAAISLAYGVMSDSLSLALLCLFAAAVLAFLQQESTALSLTKSLISAAAVAVRPVNIVLFPADLFVILAGRGGMRRKVLLSLAAAALFGAGIAISPLYQKLAHGAAAAGSPLARGLFQKAIFIEPPSEQPYRACIGDEAFAAVKQGRDYVLRAPEATRRQLELKMSDHLRFDYVIPLLARQQGAASQAEVDPRLMCYALQALRDRPAQMIGGFWTEFWALATNKPFLDQSGLAALQAYVAANPAPMQALQPLPPADAANFARAEAEFGQPPRAKAMGAEDLLPRQVRSAVVAAPLRLFGALALAAPFIAAALLLRAPNERIRLWLLAIVALGFAATAGKALSAISEFAIGRYAAVFWPLDVAVLTLFVASLAALLRGARARAALSGTPR